jgi:transposase
MARYKEYDYRQGKFLPISFDKQILPGTFEYTLNYLIDNELDLGVFDNRYCNDDTGAPAYDPAILVKIILYAYSRGITSSRKIEQCCKENIIFMALSCDTQPHFTTIADFIATLDKEIIALFLEVLLVCDALHLIGKELFAVDGVKLSSNASKEWSGTKDELTHKKEKMEQMIRHMITRHQETDAREQGKEATEREAQYVATLRENVKKIRTWLKEHDDKRGHKDKPIKSNVTDNESATMKTSHGVVQGYDGVAVVDTKHQVIVHAEAFGSPQEQALLQPMVEGVRKNLGPDIFDTTKLTADSGFHSEKNMQFLMEEEIDAYIADPQFRKRDPRFLNQDRFKERTRKEYADAHGTTTAFTIRQFTMSDDTRYCICPAGKRLHRNGGNVIVKKYRGIKFRGNKTDCLVCALRKKCLRNPDRSEVRQVYFFQGRAPSLPESFTEKMKRKIDSVKGRLLYNKRLATVEPVFGNICSTLGLNRFTLRGKRKVNIQWLLYCIVHNLLKVHRYGYEHA